MTSFHGNGADPQTEPVIARNTITSFPNRQQFLRDVGRQRAEAEVLMMVSVGNGSGYGQLVRALGHAHADCFLRAAAQRIDEVAGLGGRVYHVSLLSFALLVPAADAPGAPPLLVSPMLAALAQPLVCKSIPITARPGIGLKRLEPGGDRGEDLRRALVAVQDSRATSAGWAWYDESSDRAHLRAFQLLTDLERALSTAGQLHLAFQPKIDLATGRCRSAEALLRWTHPRLGAISPGEFVPLAEATAFVTPVTRWVVEAATAQLAAWDRQGFSPELAINISPRNLDEPDLVDFLVSCCAAQGIERERIEIEITEGVSAGQTGLARERLESLRQLGFGIALDDFGSGYSNMGQLMQLPARTLKIDRSLILGMERSAGDAQLVASIVRLGHDLGLQVVAEGIETDATRARLAGCGCDVGQGYFFARPMSADALRRWHAG